MLAAWNRRAFYNSWSRDQLSVNAKIVCFWKFLLAGAERAYLNKVTCKFPAVYLKKMKMSCENAGNGISEPLNLKIFLGEHASTTP